MKRIVIKNLIKDFKIGFAKRQSALQRFIAVFSGVDVKKKIRVLDGVSIEVSSGEILGIMGDNGSGKSTLLRLIAGIFKQDGGQIVTDGKIISLINLFAGLKDRLTMRDNIFLLGSFFGMTRREIKERFDDIVTFSELQKFVETKIYQFSNGMMQRLIFSVATHCNPDILLIDEVFEVGDEKFKKKSGGRIKELVNNGACVVLVSHDEDIIKRYCDRVVELVNGRIKKNGPILFSKQFLRLE